MPLPKRRTVLRYLLTFCFGPLSLLFLIRKTLLSDARLKLSRCLDHHLQLIVLVEHRAIFPSWLWNSWQNIVSEGRFILAHSFVGVSTLGWGRPEGESTSWQARSQTVCQCSAGFLPQFLLSRPSAHGMIPPISKMVFLPDNLLWEYLLRYASFPVLQLMLNPSMLTTRTSHYAKNVSVKATVLGAETGGCYPFLVCLHSHCDTVWHGSSLVLPVPFHFQDKNVLGRVCCNHVLHFWSYFSTLVCLDLCIVLTSYDIPLVLSLSCHCTFLPFWRGLQIISLVLIAWGWVLPGWQLFLFSFASVTLTKQMFSGLDITLALTSTT